MTQFPDCSCIEAQATPPLPHMLPASPARPVGTGIRLPPTYVAPMELHGSIIDNLSMALASAQRLRGHPVYKDTLEFWQELLGEARRGRSRLDAAQAETLGALIEQLELELAERPR